MLEHGHVQIQGSLVEFIPLLGLLGASCSGAVVEEAVGLFRGGEENGHLLVIVVHEGQVEMPNMVDLLGWSQHLLADDGHQNELFVLKHILVGE